MSKYTWILDPGHGGLGPGGEYLTPGKRSPAIPPGIYEGEFNRNIAASVVALLPGIATTVTNPGPINAGLYSRVKYARALHKIRKNCVFISIHANALGDGSRWNDAQGATVFHHPKDARGRELALWLLDSIDQHTEIGTERGIKTSRFTVLSGTRAMPSVLVECGFMTNLYDAQRLALASSRENIARAISNTIAQFEHVGGL